MKSLFKEIFVYHHHFNQKLGEQIIMNEQQVSEKILFLFSHVILSQQVWNARILGRNTMDLNQTLELSECLNLDKFNFALTDKIIEEMKLNKYISYSNSKGQKFRNSVVDILFHLSNHSTHHKGQIVAELRRGGIDPVITDYIFSKRVEEIL